MSKVSYRRKFKFFESENVSITVIDYGSVREKCQYCNHPLRYHYVVDDKKTGQARRMKVGCECVKFFLRQAGVDEVLIERADKIIKKQMAALNHVRKFENLDVDKLYNVMVNVLSFNSSRITAVINEMVNKEMKEKYNYESTWGMRKERDELRKVVRKNASVQALFEMQKSDSYLESKKVWEKKYYGKYRGLSGLYWTYRNTPGKFSKEALENWRQRTISGYLGTITSPYYFNH